LALLGSNLEEGFKAPPVLTSTGAIGVEGYGPDRQKELLRGLCSPVAQPFRATEIIGAKVVRVELADTTAAPAATCSLNALQQLPVLLVPIHPAATSPPFLAAAYADAADASPAACATTSAEVSAASPHHAAAVDASTPTYAHANPVAHAADACATTAEAISAASPLH
jgi:hypothetical protein